MNSTPSRTKASRSEKRMNYDADTIHAILDEADVCTISYVKDGEPRALPTGHVRIGEYLYIHGSVKSHFFTQLENAGMVCITASILDGLVLAKSGLNHSFNYRSVAVFGAPLTVSGNEKKEQILAAFTDRYVAGRWQEIRQPTIPELNATKIIGFQIQEASAKIRQGPPNDLEKDKEWPVWSGVVPMKIQVLEPVPDENNSINSEIPGIKKTYPKS